MSAPQLHISNLSSHLFWDVDRTKINFETSKPFIVQRVLEYGVLSDWKAIVHVYGLEQIKEIAMQLRTLDSVSLSFLCTIFKLKKIDFRCFKLSQSMPNYWSY